MKTEDLKAIEKEIDTVVANCIQLCRLFPRFPKTRRITFDTGEVFKRKRVHKSLVEETVKLLQSRNISIEETSNHGSIVCTIDLNKVALNLEQAKLFTQSKNR